MPEPDLKKVIDDVLESILDLEEQINDLVLQQSAMLEALARLLPQFPQEFGRAYTDAQAEQAKCENEGAPSVREVLEKLRKLRET